MKIVLTLKMYLVPNVDNPIVRIPIWQETQTFETHMIGDFTTEKTPEDNPGVLVKLPNLEKKYGMSMYLMDRKSGHLYITGIEGYKQIDEKGLLYLQNQ